MYPRTLGLMSNSRIIDVGAGGSQERTGTATPLSVIVKSAFVRFTANVPIAGAVPGANITAA